jgi:hypothetical protein
MLLVFIAHLFDHLSFAVSRTMTLLMAPGTPRACGGGASVAQGLMVTNTPAVHPPILVGMPRARPMPTVLPVRARPLVGDNLIALEDI